MNIELVWPWLLVLWPLPYLVQRTVRPRTRHALAIQARLPTLTQAASEQHGAKPVQHPLQQFMLWCMWTALLLAATRPEQPGEAVAAPSSGRDLMLVVDISGSMNTEDMVIDGQPVNRLDAVKLVLHKFIDHRAGDRIGLLVFGSAPFLYVPLTYDHATLMHMLLEMQSGIAGNKTAIGDATGLAVKTLRDRPANDRVMILLTDGANNAGELRPEVAAGIAAQYKVRIHSVGFGADTLRLPSGFGFDLQLMTPSAELDEATLQQLAKKTGGRYFRARDSGGLREVYQIIDRMEPVPQNDQRLQPVTALYHWPLAVACAIALLLLLFTTRGPSTPEAARQHA